ncbi:FAD-dependent oxidoreductase [Pseudomonas aeruginosa]
MPTLEHAQHSFDLVVLGSGAGGFAAAATAARRGLKVLVVEKAEHFGGTSAISGGAVWLYGTDQARAAGAKDSPEAMHTYLKQVIGNGYDPTLADAFIEHGHQALRWLEQNTELRYALRPHSPDYYPDAPGATQFGRALGERERFPHLVTDRAKPGVIAVNLAGQRFVNESDSYHPFVQTLEQFNTDARNGIDRAFGKGGNSYNRYMGDPQHTPNPCLAPLASGPFYAIRIHTGDLGSARGLVTNAQANVLNRDGQPIAGLYAVGNDMNSLMKGTYPGPGITLGPALAFGWLAANHIAARLQAPATHMETPACTTN